MVKGCGFYLFEGTLGEQVTFDTGQRLVWVVVRLFDQPELLPLRVVQTTLHAETKTRRIINPMRVWLPVVPRQRGI